MANKEAGYPDFGELMMFPSNPDDGDFVPSSPECKFLDAIAMVLKTNGLTWDVVKECEGCKWDQPNQLAHECLTMNQHEIVEKQLDRAWSTPISRRSIYKEFGRQLEASHVPPKNIVSFFRRFPQPEVLFMHYMPVKWLCYINLKVKFMLQHQWPKNMMEFDNEEEAEEEMNLEEILEEYPWDQYRSVIKKKMTLVK